MNASEFLDMHGSLSQAGATIGAARAMGERLQAHGDIQACLRLAQKTLNTAIETMEAMQREQRRQLDLAPNLALTFQTTGRR